MAGFDFDWDGKCPAVDWAIPDIMIAFPMPDKTALLLRKDGPDTFFVLSHQDTTSSLRSDAEKIKAAAFSQPFSSKISGAA